MERFQHLAAGAASGTTKLQQLILLYLTRILKSKFVFSFFFNSLKSCVTINAIYNIYKYHVLNIIHD